VIGGGTSGDRHTLIIDRDRWLLYETFATMWNSAAGRWEAGSGAVFDMNTNNRRPTGWTSADAAGLAIFPGLIRYDETFGTAEITHAFRVTVRASNGYVWPRRTQPVQTQRAAHGCASAAESVEEYFWFHTRGAAALSSDETLRPHRRRQRL
jgi:hypothetical protein